MAKTVIGLIDNLGEAQAIMQKLGYSDAKPLQIKIQTRNLPSYRDAAVIVSDQLKKIYIAGELDILDTPRWYSKLSRKEYTIGVNITGVSVDEAPEPSRNRRRDEPDAARRRRSRRRRPPGGGGRRDRGVERERRARLASRPHHRPVRARVGGRHAAGAVASVIGPLRPM